MKKDELDHELILAFYSDFYRFETALRKAGYTKDGQPTHADWDRFLGAIERHFDPNTDPFLSGAYITLLDYAYKNVRVPRIKGAIREIVLASEIIQKMGNDLTRGTILRNYSETEISTLYAATQILSVWANLEPSVKQIWNITNIAK